MKQEHLIARHPLGATVAAHLVSEYALRQVKLPHHPMPLLVAIQFWRGDRDRALRLARFLADIEPAFREDTMIALAARFDVPLDAEIYEAMMDVGRKFPVTFIRSLREAEGHPDGCHGLWAGTAEACFRRWLKGWRCANVFFAEADGVPARYDWIDAIKAAHAENLERGKRVTGARMDGTKYYDSHVNGSLLMHISALSSHPEWLECPSGEAWDCFHGTTFLQELGPVRSVLNLYGAHDVSLSVYKTIGANWAWIASVKDESAWECAQTLTGAPWKRLADSIKPSRIPRFLRRRLLRT